MAAEFGSVSVVGLGYIGLPTAATLAASGMTVKGVDISPRVVSELNEGRAHFAEPDLDGLVQSAVSSGRLRAYTEPQPADAFIIAVPTPMMADKSPDMRAVEAAAKSVASVLEPGNLVILESTSPLGTTETIAQIVRTERPDLVNDDTTLAVALAYCPERILPGKMVTELTQNDRVVGGITPDCAEHARDLYRLFVRGEIFLTNAATAEIVKLMENAYRDVNIAFANEIANICEANGIDPWEAIALANRHPRVDILSPGPGVGGHCIAIDPWFLITRNPGLADLMAAARAVNDGRPVSVIARIRAAAEAAGSKRIACLGLAFKPNVDDLRESPAVAIVETLADEGFEIAVAEPHASELPERLRGRANVRLVGAEEAIAGADVVAALVAHAKFADLGAAIEGKRLIDAVGLFRARRLG